MDHYTRSFPTDAQQAPGTGDRDPPDFLAFLAEADLLPLATYLQLQNRELDGKPSGSDTLISLGLIDPTRLAQLHAEHLAEGYIDLTHFPPNPDLLKILGPVTALQMGVLPWRLSTGVTVILTDRPEHYDQNQAYLRQIFGPLRRAFACPDQTRPDQMRSYITTTEETALIHRAEHRVAARKSCRDLNFKILHICPVELDRCRHSDQRLCASHYILERRPMGNPDFDRQYGAETHHRDLVFASWSDGQTQI